MSVQFSSQAAGIFHVPTPVNEPVLAYAPGEAKRDSLKAKLKQMASERIEIPLVIGGKEIRTGKKRQAVMPHSHREVVADFHLAGPEEMKLAVAAARKAKGEWESLPWQERAAVFLKAADLLAGPYRDTHNAATMLGQSKNAYQAEIDSACELIDFLRYNTQYYEQILGMQPSSSAGIWNRLDHRPLEGFVMAITPFNFSAIAGNLPTSPALCGNTVVWKPANTQVLAAWHFYQIMREAGLPDGVINFVPTDGASVGKYLIPDPELAGVHFTGSTGTFQSIYRTVGENLASYKSIPRIVAETGGKDFVFAAPSADAAAVATALARGAFEYQGQKCSAASRAYIPRSLWPKIQEQLVADIKSMKMGDVRDFRNFVNAVIDEKAFKEISSHIEWARASSTSKILVGGKCNMETGYFIEPTVIVTEDPKSKTMSEEIFGPVLTIYVYDDAKFEETLKLCDETSPYALTGAIFSQDRYVIGKMASALRHAAGNFYVNDKPTGAVVGQQPFGGARASGTNDKAGSILNLFRWLSPRSIKETFVPPKAYGYPFLGAE
jgi:1-pyrroline-5-carboxylate dehydrogenase